MYREILPRGIDPKIWVEKNKKIAPLILGVLNADMNHQVRAQDTQKVTDPVVNRIVWRGLTALKAAFQIYQISAGNFVLSYFAIN